MPMQTRDGWWCLPWLPSHFFSDRICFWTWLELSYMARLANLQSAVCLAPSPSAMITGRCYCAPSFSCVWVSGIQAWVLMYVCQVFNWLGHVPSSYCPLLRIFSPLSMCPILCLHQYFSDCFLSHAACEEFHLSLLHNSHCLSFLHCRFVKLYLLKGWTLTPLTSDLLNTDIMVCICPKCWLGSSTDTNTLYSQCAGQLLIFFMIFLTEALDTLFLFPNIWEFSRSFSIIHF